jgi:hypothetical protein
MDVDAPRRWASDAVAGDDADGRKLADLGDDLRGVIDSAV